LTNSINSATPAALAQPHPITSQLPQSQAEWQQFASTLNQWLKTLSTPGGAGGAAGTYLPTFQAGYAEYCGPGNVFTANANFIFGLSIPNPSGTPAPAFLLGSGVPQAWIVTDQAFSNATAGTNLGITAGETQPAGTANGGALTLYGGACFGGTGGSTLVQGGTSRNGSGGSTTIAGGNSTSGTPGDVFIIGGQNGTQGANVHLIMTSIAGAAGVLRIRVNSTILYEINQYGAMFVGGGAGTTGQALTSGGSGASPSWKTPNPYDQSDIRNFGAILDGVTDCSAAMIAAAAQGGLITIPGSMALNSGALAVLPNASITLISGTTIRGVPGYPIVITGSVACNVFRSTDASNIKFEDIYAIGNNVGTATTGYFWYIKCTATATQTATNLQFLRGGLENFAGYYWIYIDNTAAVTYAITKFLADGGSFTSKLGNCQGNTDIQKTASVFGFSGSDTVTTFYTVKDCIVRNCVANGTFIKSFVYFWSGVLRGKAYDNILEGFGTDANILDDMGSYALVTYDHSHAVGLLPDEIEFYGNTIDRVKDVGIYCAGVIRLTVKNNVVSGQTSTANTTLPKGGLALNAPTYLTCTGNRMNNCAIGMSITQSPTNIWARFNDNVIELIPASGKGVILSGTTGGNAPDISINGLSIHTAAASVTGILNSFSVNVGCDNLDIQNFDITGCATGINLVANDSSVPTLGNVRIGQGKFRKISGTNLRWLTATNATTRLVLENLTLSDMVSGSTGIAVTGALSVTARNIVFQDLAGAAFCWVAGGTQGRLSGMQFANVPVANRYDAAANRLGVDVPTWTGNDNDVVEDLNPNELGAAAAKYQRIAWSWDRVAAAWKERRCLTGN
jgi:hypothetical protein